MIRNLFDIEKISDDDDKIGGDKKNAEDSEAAAGDRPDDRTEADQPDRPRTGRIKNIAAEEIIRLPAGDRDKPNEEEPAPPKTEKTSPPTVGEMLSDETLIELEEAARKIEEEETRNASGTAAIPVDEDAGRESERLKRLESEVAEIENELLREKEEEEKRRTKKKKRSAATAEAVSPIFSGTETEEEPAGPEESETISRRRDSRPAPSFLSIDDDDTDEPSEAMSRADMIRKSGLAYSAAIVLLGAVIFMMLIGWGADLLLGTSPWGIVIGIIIGAAIGFVQFFRVTSQIFKK